MKKPIALLLCGGLGTRMQPWHARRNKCLVGVENGEPLFARHVRKLREGGFEVWAKVPMEHELAFGEAAKPDHWISEETPAPSGSCLLEVARKTKRRILTVVGDAWFDDGWYKDMFRRRDGPGNIGWIATEEPPDLGADWRGILETQFDGGARYVTKVHETVNPKDHWKNPVFSAAMIYWPSGIEKISMPGDLMGHVLPAALEAGFRFQCLHMAVKPGEFSADLGTPERYASWVLRRFTGRYDDGKAAVAILKSERILTFGNGGAGTVAAHAALDWQKVGGKDVTCLNDGDKLSAWSNDGHFIDAIEAQVARAKLTHKDAVVLFSASGESHNILLALNAARCHPNQPRTVAVTRFNSKLVDECEFKATYSAPGPKNTWGYGPLEDWMANWMHGVTAVMEGLRPWH